MKVISLTKSLRDCVLIANAIIYCLLRRNGGTSGGGYVCYYIVIKDFMGNGCPVFKPVIFSGFCRIPQNGKLLSTLRLQHHCGYEPQIGDLGSCTIYLF